MKTSTVSAALGYSALFVASVLAVGCGDSSAVGGGGSSEGGHGGEAATGGAGGIASQGGGGGGAVSDWAAYCDARGAACTNLDVDACKMQEQCAKDLLKDAIEDDLLTCLSTQCNGDTCVAATADTPLTDQGQSFLDSCMGWLQACPDSSSDDLCSTASYVADDKLADLETCMLAPTCADATNCLTPILDQFNACEAWL